MYIIKNYKMTDVFPENLAISLVCIFFSLIFQYNLSQEYGMTITFYLIILTNAILFAELADITYKRTVFSRIFWSISFFLLFFLLGCRDFSGIDDGTYREIFNEIRNSNPIEYFIDTKLEPGYIILNYFISVFTKEYIYVQMICSFIPLCFLYAAFYREKYNLALSVFLLYTTFYFQVLSHGLVRNFMSVSIFFYALRYLHEKKLKKYLLYILLAASFHFSAFFMLVFSYFAVADRTWKGSIKFVTFAIFLIPLIFIFIANFIVPYLGVRHTDYGILGELVFQRGDFDTFPILLIILITSIQFVKLYEKDRFILLVTIFSLSSIISFYSSLVPLGRLIFYINSVLYLLFPFCYKYLKGSFERFLLGSISMAYGFLYLYVTEFNNAFTAPFLMPYKNILFSL